MIVEILINSTVKKLNKVFDYIVPKSMEKEIHIGTRVVVPFGKIKKEEGIVFKIKQESEFANKEILEITSNDLNEKNVELAKLMSKKYFCNIFDNLKLMLPPGTISKNIENRVKDKNANFVYLLKDKDEIDYCIANKLIKSDKQIRAINLLLEIGKIELSELIEVAEVSSSVIKTLEKNEYIEIVPEKVERNPFINKDIERDIKLLLNDEQKHAYCEIKKSIDEKVFKEFLIYGITGSGKTEIYLQLIETVLKNKQTAIILVPEISLTPQMVNRFIARFGEKIIAVLHSKLSSGERYDQWQKINNGEAKIVIGARSAIFAPIKKLGLIIIDEEHDMSYKSDTTPRYNAKDIAKYIAKQNNIPLILGSATPDICTFYKTKNNTSKLLKLTKRANSANLPDVEIIDLRQELAMGNKSMISFKLHEEIEKNIKNNKQTILFLNRRGYSTFIMCRECGHTITCKNCSVTMTYHLNKNILKCHYCGYEQKPVNQCPQCKSSKIKYFGTGTQKLEKEINKLFPSATILRMDIDTITKKNSHELILEKFKNENINILIGTQMVVKGHHFPNVTLVGVIAADTTLNIEDYRATERTFQILTQVAGRAGRENNKGTVVIQTYNPDNYSIEYSKQQDYKLLYNTEIEIRKTLKYPPFCDIILISVDSNVEKKVIENINFIYKYLKHTTDNVPEFNIYKPVPSPINKIKNKFRWRIIIKCKFNSNIQKTINNVLEEIYKKDDKSIKLIVDVNPNNML